METPDTLAAKITTLNALASVRTIDDAIGMIPQVEAELDRIDPTKKIKIALLIAISAKIPLSNTVLIMLHEARMDMSLIMERNGMSGSSIPQISRKLYYIFEAFLARIDALIDGTQEIEQITGVAQKRLGKILDMLSDALSREASL